MEPINKYKIKKTIREKERKTKTRNIPVKVQTIAQQVHDVDIELHFLRTLGAAKDRSLRRGGLYGLLSHRYIQSAIDLDRMYTQSSASTSTESQRVEHNYTTVNNTGFPSPSQMLTDENSHTSILYYNVTQNTDAWLQL